MEIKKIESIIEGILFASGDVISTDKIAEVLEIDKKTIKLIIQKLSDQYEDNARGIVIREIDNGYQMCSRPEYHEYISKLFESRQKQGLSQAAYEVLAIIAYNQPVTRSGVEKIRGVNSDHVIVKLIERGLVQEAGKMDAPGKPMLYEITEEFLRCFGIRSVGDLPLLDFGII